MPLIIACVQSGNYEGRGAEYVNRLARGVKRHLKLPYQFACFADDLSGLDNWYVDWQQRLQPGITGWWNKLTLFAPGRFPDGARIVFFDLDTLITGPLDAIAKWNGDFALLRDFHRPDGFGSGVMMWRAGFGTQIWNSWCEAGRPEIKGGDQAWIEKIILGNREGAPQGDAGGRPSEPSSDRAHPTGNGIVGQSGRAATLLQDAFPDAFVSFKQHCGQGLPAKASVVCFHGRPKPHDCEAAWVNDHWK